ncbi:MAG: hypothetical protein B7Z62_08285 [Deltaproteobacteria bacterium 37-65-8]|nr:MAG: hypothetical protein B7Z62_08285 [Deltaproteobacteria bacterium 37-65-8]HQT95257.1 hypothetical protein [Thermoanaerobaculaceae bacterium]
MSDSILAALVAAGVSALVSLTVALAQLRQGKASHRSRIQRDISAKYDKMLDYRLQRPEVLTRAHNWGPECFAEIYSRDDDEGRTWAIYYGYVELVIFYCNAVLHARDKGLLDPGGYEYEHEPLIRLLLAEHYPILSEIVRPGGYVTRYLVEHVAELQRQGWDWKAEHQRLSI